MAARRFEVGQRVIIKVTGEVGIIDRDDGDPEFMAPYWIGDDCFDANELENAPPVPGADYEVRRTVANFIEGNWEGSNEDQRAILYGLANELSLVIEHPSVVVKV